ELVGRVTHGRDGDDDLVARLAGLDDPLGDPLDALGVSDARAAELLHDQGHGRALQRGKRTPSSYRGAYAPRFRRRATPAQVSSDGAPRGGRTRTPQP